MARDIVSVIFNKDVEKAILNGCEKVAQAVGSTHGPCGNNVILDTDTLYPTITKDGVTVAKMLYDLTDPHERMAAQILINIAVKQLYDCGDGTTAAIVIANEILKLGMKAVSRGTNPAKLQEGIKLGCKDIVSGLKAIVKDSKDLEALSNIATISTNNNKELGEIIANAMLKVGEYGIVEHGVSTTNEHLVEYTDGYQWTKGLVSPYFMTDRKTFSAVLESPLILVTDHIITYAQEILPLFEKIDAYNKEKGIVYPVVIVADFNPMGEALPLLAENTAKGKIQCACVSPDGLAEQKINNLQDISVVTGATFITKAKGLRLQDATVEDLGSCDRFKATLKKSMIIKGKLLLSEYAVLTDNLKEIQETAKNEIEKKEAGERLARLDGGVATILVGGKTETEQREAVDRVDDAIRATKTAYEHGVVSGGGCAYIEARSALIDLGCIKDKEVLRGYQITMKAIEAPIHNILQNASMNIADPTYYRGYDAHNRHSVIDMFDYGIIDPLHVVVSALENAVSVASLLLVSKTMVVKDRTPINMQEELKS